MPRISLIPVHSDESFALTLPIALVGSKPDCDFCIEGDGVAEMHCVLVAADDIALLRDLDTGRTRVNGQRVRRAALLPNDVLMIGSRQFRVEYAGNGPPTYTAGD
jgi:pSer/pThr/pTyr-binding forkhead associated (FHA) protein